MIILLNYQKLKNMEKIPNDIAHNQRTKGPFECVWEVVVVYNEVQVEQV